MENFLLIYDDKSLTFFDEKWPKNLTTHENEAMQIMIIVQYYSQYFDIMIFN